MNHTPPQPSSHSALDVASHDEDALSLNSRVMKIEETTHAPSQHEAHREAQDAAKRALSMWNKLHDSTGSYADHHSTL